MLWLNARLSSSSNCTRNVNNPILVRVQSHHDTRMQRHFKLARWRTQGKLPMLVLGCAAHRRHGWKENPQGKLASRLKFSRRHPTIFDAITSFGEDPEDLPGNFFPLDGVGHDSAAAILRDGELIAAAAEERFNPFKHSTGAGGNTLAPRQAVEF